MWWYNAGWWWWWLAFVILFFLLPLGYGWGYRGYGPWYRRRNPGGSARTNLPPTAEPPLDEEDMGWGWGGIFLWLVLIIAAIWLVAAWGWGGHR